jgi:glutamyl-tRNA reductase
MKLLCCGINHRTASIAIREHFALSETTLMPALQDLQNTLQEHEAMLVSTCNRLELYALINSKDVIVNWLAAYFDISLEQLQPLLYFKYDEHVVEHAIRVASGLDSMILGEPQILGQMKCAYAQAGEAGCIGQHLGHLFPFVFSVAKRIRTETEIGHSSVSVASTAVNLAKQNIQDLSVCNVLLVGAGETMELVAEHLVAYGVNRIWVANRTSERAEVLAERYKARSIMIRDIPNHLAEIDIIISSTASQLPLIGKGLVERVMKQRMGKSMFIVDIAVPRDVEPEVMEVRNVSLYNIDDLQTIVAENKKSRDIASAQAELIVAEELKKYVQRMAALDSVPAICAYRQHMENIRDLELKKAMTDLQLGKDPELVIKDLARVLTNKLMHHPSVEMRKASSEGRTDLLQWSKQLLGIQANESVNSEQTEKFG